LPKQAVCSIDMNAFLFIFLQTRLEE